MPARRSALTVGAVDTGELVVPTPAGVSLATFAGFDAEGRFRVALNDDAEPVVALSTVCLVPDDVGATVVVAYEEGSLGRLIIIGRVRDRAVAEAQRVTVDGQRVLIRAARELELRCGDASIVLTRAGKVLIRGNFVLTRSRGANKIKGAYVAIN